MIESYPKVNEDCRRFGCCFHNREEKIKNECGRTQKRKFQRCCRCGELNDL